MRHHIPDDQADAHRPALDCPCAPTRDEQDPGRVDHHPIPADQRQEVDPGAVADQ